jgi:hypothetical protein
VALFELSGICSVSLATIDQPSALPAVAGPVTLRDELELWQEAFEFAKAIAPTELVPKAFRNRPDAVMATIIKGHELGVPALHALSQIYVIDGRPCVAAELQRALILSHGHEVWSDPDYYNATRVDLYGRRRGGQHVQRITWTIDDAKRANLAGKPNWRTYPRQMLLARCSGELGRLMFADVLAGLGVNYEELLDGVEVLEGPVGEPPPDAPPPRASRTRRTRQAAKSDGASGRSPGKAPSPPVAEIPGAPPPLPGEEGYTDPGHPTLVDNTFRPTERHSGADPVPSETTDGPEPAEVVTKRAQAIAIRARDAGVDHHHVVAAVTHGRTESAKDLNAPEADAVLRALVELQAGRLELIEPDGDLGWDLVTPGPPEPDESAAERYQARVRDLKRQKDELEGKLDLPAPDDIPTTGAPAPDRKDLE